MKKRKWLLSVSIVGGVILLCIVAVVAFGAAPSAKGSGVSKNRPLWVKEETSSASASYPDYSFSLTWDVYGISSYDSESGTLIKTKDATNPKDYTTNLKLTPKQYAEVWKLIKGLDIASYPDKYNPHENGVSIPYMTLILSVKADGIDKTVTVDETVLSYETSNAKGQKFLDVCKGIRDILTETDAWKALPEYEFLYD